MIIDHQRDKLINAIIFFARNTQSCHKVKLFKLLYFLDFEHYSLTGRSVTGLEYYSYPKGPYPKALNGELTSPLPDMKAHIQFEKIPFQGGEKLNIFPMKEFDSSHLSKRELRIMEGLAQEYKFANAADMIEETHLENSPWHQIYEVEKKEFALIPYELALKKQEKEEIKQHLEESQEFWQAYS